MGQTDQVREYVSKNFIEPARKRGETHVRITAGDVHRELNLSRRVPLVCNALRSKEFLQTNHLHLESVSGPPSGMSTTVVFTYRLADDVPAPEGLRAALGRYRGSCREAFAQLGGGEVFLKAERASFEIK